MGTSILLAIGSFALMLSLVVQNARRIKLGNVHELHPINLYDLSRPTFEMWRKTTRALLHLAWTTVLAWSHVMSLSAARKLFELSVLVKKRRASEKNRGHAHRIWKEMAYEKERIKAHFVTTPANTNTKE